MPAGKLRTAALATFVVSVVFSALIAAGTAWSVWVQAQHGWQEPGSAIFGIALMLLVLAGSLAMVISRWNVLRRSTGDDAVDAAFWRKDRWHVLSKRLIWLVFAILFGTFAVTILRQ
jgi:hypothetical protein